MNPSLYAEQMSKVYAQKNWNSSQKIIYGYLLSINQSEDNSLVLPPITLENIGEHIGSHPQTVGNVINALQEAGLVDHETITTFTDKNGIPLRGRKYNPTKDKVKKISVWNKTIIPDILPQLQETKQTQKKRNYQARITSEWRKDSAKVKQYESGLICPNCGKAGHMEIAISAKCNCCNQWVRGRQLDELVRQSEENQYNVELSQHTENCHRDVELSHHDENFSKNKSEVLSDSTYDISTSYCTEPLLSTVPSSPSLLLLSERVSCDKADVTEGKESVERFAATFGAQQAYTICKGYTKKPQGLEWTQKPRTLEEAVREVEQNNIGVLPEYSSVLGVDIDRHLTYFLQKYPQLQKYSIVYRENDLERGKIIVPVSDMMPKFSLDDKIEFGLKIEIIGSGGHFVIAGTHESGASIKILWGTEDKVLTCQQVASIAHEYIPATIERKIPSKLPLASEMRPVSQQNGGDMPKWMIFENYALLHKDAIIEFLGGNIDRFSIRPDDKTPSVIRSTKGFERDTWRDFGDHTEHEEYGKADSGGRIWDWFDLFVLMRSKGNLNNFKNIKRECVRQAKEYYDNRK